MKATNGQQTSPAVGALTEEERYLFDLEGFLVIEDAISAEHVEELNELLDDYDLWNNAGEGRFYALWTNGEHFRTVGECHLWDEPFRRLIANPRVTPYLLELLGPTFRYDCGQALLMRRGGEKLRLHGGGCPWDPAQFYHVQNGQIYNGLVVVSYALRDSESEDGGFAAVPGSHKSNFPRPTSFTFFETTGPWVRRVPQKAGSAIIFTEALTHGTWPWTADFERRNLLYCYCPGHMAYGDVFSRETRLEHGYPTGWYPVPADVPDAAWPADVVRMLEPPYVWDRPPAIG